jgi:hypothetical protein
MRVHFRLLLCLGGAATINAASLTVNDAYPLADSYSYKILGVSGTLQDGFPLRPRLDWRDENNTVVAPAVFIGTGLVRGFKAYLDIKDAASNEYQAPPMLPRIPNAVVMPTKCYTDANIFYIFAVAEQALLEIWLHEPRFLSISADTGWVDVTDAASSDSVRRLIYHRTKQAGMQDEGTYSRVTLPLVTGIYFSALSFVESPPVEERDDGTRVYSFDGSLAQWIDMKTPQSSVSKPYQHYSQTFSQDHWDALFVKIRQAEEALRKQQFTATPPWNVTCSDDRLVTFGSAVHDARLHSSWTLWQLENALGMDAGMLV